MAVWHAFLLFIGALCLCSGDRLVFNYHFLYIGQDCATLGWNYIRTTCNPVIFTLEALSLQDIMSSDFNTPRLSYTSASGRFSFLTRNLLGMELYFRVLALDSSGSTCASDQFYNFTMILQNGIEALCFPMQAAAMCLEVPNTSIFPVFYWPVGMNTLDGYCYCKPHSLLFAGCATRCASIYQFSLESNGSLCLQQSNVPQQGNGTLKVHFILDSVLSVSSDRYFIISIFSSQWIARASCANGQMGTLFNRSRTRNLLMYRTGSYNISFLDNITSILHIHVTATTTQPQQVEWRHNNRMINADSRISIHTGGLTIDEVEPSDAGYYEIIAVFSNELGCESAQFRVNVHYLSSYCQLEDASNVTINCVAVGYPNVYIEWQTGTGQNVSNETLISTRTDNGEFNVTLSTSLTLENYEDCGRLWGYTCVFNNGLLLSPMEVFIQCPHGPPSEPVDSYFNSTTICYESFSHPDFPVEYFAVTMLNTVEPHFSVNVNVSQCQDIPCGIIQLSIVAISSLGISKMRQLQITNVDDASCDSESVPSHNDSSCHFTDVMSLHIQIYLHGMKNCEEMDYDLIVIDFSSLLLNHIRNYCGCNASIHQPAYQCSKTDPNDVAFRASIVSCSDAEIAEAISILHIWVQSQMSVVILGETFLVENENCPLEISSVNDSVCQPSRNVSRHPNYIAIGSVLAALGGVLLVFSIIIPCLLAYRKIKCFERTKNSPNQQNPTHYEDIDDLNISRSSTVPIYEEILPSNEECKSRSKTVEDFTMESSTYQFTTCPAYDILPKQLS